MAARACVSTQGAAAFTQRVMVVRLHFPNWACCRCYHSDALASRREEHFGIWEVGSNRRSRGCTEGHVVWLKPLFRRSLSHHVILPTQGCSLLRQAAPALLNHGAMPLLHPVRTPASQPLLGGVLPEAYRVH